MDNRWQAVLKDKIWYLFLVCILKTLLWLPHFLAFFVVWLLTTFKRKDDRWIEKNVERVYGLPAKSHFAKMFHRQIIQHQVFCGLEMIKFSKLAHQMHVEGMKELTSCVEESLKAGNGLIVVTGHVGSWELVAHYTGRAAKQPFFALAKPPKIKAGRQLLEKFRSALGVTVLWTDRKSLLRQMMEILKANQVLGFVMDQKPDKRVGIPVSFLGEKTVFVSGPAKMAIKLGAPILAVFCVRQGPWQYRLICQRVASHGNENEITQRMAGEIESIIRRYPEQWVWNYKRWSISD